MGRPARTGWTWPSDAAVRLSTAGAWPWSKCPGGDEFVDVVPSTKAEYLRVRAAISSGVITTPWRRTRGAFGTWAYFRDTVTLLRQVVEHLGWTLDDEESALLDALAGYRPGRALGSE